MNSSGTLLAQLGDEPLQKPLMQLDMGYFLFSSYVNAIVSNNTPSIKKVELFQLASGSIESFLEEIKSYIESQGKEKFFESKLYANMYIALGKLKKKCLISDKELQEIGGKVGLSMESLPLPKKISDFSTRLYTNIYGIENSHLGNLGFTYLELGNYKEALSCYKKAIELEPGNVTIWGNLGEAYLELEEYEEAKKAFEKATELEPSNAVFWGNLGEAYFELEEYEEAKKAFEKATELKASNAVFWNNFGSTYFRLEEYEEAKKAFEKATELEPSNAVFWNNFGDAYSKLGENHEASICQQKAYDLSPDNHA